MNKINVFENELNLIKNNSIRKFAEFILNKLPGYFWIVPASGSGKYHPEYTLGEGGLVRHVKATVKIANELFRNETICNGEFDQQTKDMIITALILHDGCKNGFDDISDRMRPEHPILICKFIDQYRNDINNISETEIDSIKSLILTHMGQWNTDREGKEILPKPCMEIQKFVHLCDYLASRKCIEIKL